MRKPFCSSLIILGRRGLSLLVMHKEINLYVVFNSEMGLQFFRRSRAFPVFGRQVINPCVCDWDSELFSKHS